MKKYKVGVIGCGDISDIYIRNLQNKFDNTRVFAVTDHTRSKAIDKQKRYDIAFVYDDSDELIHCPEIDIILILTRPSSHAELVKKALMAGKHVYCEKPIALSMSELYEIKDLAGMLDLHFASAPDTILGALMQTGRKLLDEGCIGEIIGADICLSVIPPETWHPNPSFLYKKGAGPLLDNGPYLIAALVYMFGPVTEIVGMGRRTWKYRTILSKEHFREKINVEVPTFIKGIFKFYNGVIVSIMLSTDSRYCRANETGFEIYGKKGTLILSHPKQFDGIIEFQSDKTERWISIPLIAGYTDNCRGIGVSELANALEKGRSPVISEDFVFHVTECLLGFERACLEGKKIYIKSSCKKPERLAQF